MTIEIHLNKGYITIIDDQDADLVQYKWYISTPGYAVGRPDTRDKRALHRIILERKLNRKLNKGEDTDHINRNKLDNRRSNLRVATHAQNCRNQSGHFDGSSRYKGVCYHKDTGRWRASVDGQHIGLFSTEKEAALAHDAVARQKHGNFAYLNFPNIHRNLDDLKPALQSNNTSGYRGIHQDKRTGYWKAEIVAAGQKYRLGVFRTAEQAAQAYDQKAIELLGNDANLNFPDSTYELPALQNTINLNNTSGYRGVYYFKARNVWCAEITIDYKKNHLGCFSTPEQAARAYDKAAIKIGRISKLNFPND